MTRRERWCQDYTTGTPVHTHGPHTAMSAEKLCLVLRLMVFHAKVCRVRLNYSGVRLSFLELDWSEYKAFLDLNWLKKTKKSWFSFSLLLVWVAFTLCYVGGCLWNRFDSILLLNGCVFHGKYWMPTRKSCFLGGIVYVNVNSSFSEVEIGLENSVLIILIYCMLFHAKVFKNCLFF